MKTSIPQRKKILKLFREEKMSIQDIMEEMNLSYFKVYNVVQGRVKTNYSPRADKGVSRSIDEDERMSEKVDLENFDDVYGFLEHQIVLVARSMNKTKLGADERLKMIKDLTAQQKNLQALKLESHLGNTDAVLIARLLRRQKPDLTDDDIIRMVREEQTKLSTEGNS